MDITNKDSHPARRPANIPYYRRLRSGPDCPHNFRQARSGTPPVRCSSQTAEHRGVRDGNFVTPFDNTIANRTDASSRRTIGTAIQSAFSEHPCMWREARQRFDRLNVNSQGITRFGATDEDRPVHGIAPRHRFLIATILGLSQLSGKSIL